MCPKCDVLQINSHPSFVSKSGQQPERETGVVKWFSERKGYGFIKPDVTGKDVFLHVSRLKVDRIEAEELIRGQRISFVRQERDGHEVATYLQLMPPSPNVQGGLESMSLSDWIEGKVLVVINDKEIAFVTTNAEEKLFLPWEVLMTGLAKLPKNSPLLSLTIADIRGTEVWFKAVKNERLDTKYRKATKRIVSIVRFDKQT